MQIDETNFENGDDGRRNKGKPRSAAKREGLVKEYSRETEHTVDMLARDIVMYREGILGLSMLVGTVYVPKIYILYPC
jgi:hypothetical protein